MGPSTVDNTTELLRIYHAVVEAGAGQEIGDDEDLLGGLALKSFLHCASAIHLANVPTTFPTLPSAVPDGGSILVLCRAGFEALFTVHALFLAPKSEAREGRLLMWKLGGALARSDLQATTEEHRAEKAADAVEADRLLDALRLNGWYCRLPEEVRNSVKPDTWKRKKSWSQLAVGAGMDRRLARESYGSLCGYAHSGALSAGQSGAMGGGASRKSFAETALWHLQAPLALIALAYVRRFDGARSYLDQAPAAKKLLGCYAELGRSGGRGRA